jgi:hypothetical protein
MPSCRVPIVLTLQIETPRFLAEALAEVRQLIREIGVSMGHRWRLDHAFC